MTEQHPNIRLIERFFAAYSNSDFEAMQQVMAVDVKWHIPGKHPYSGTKNGVKELMKYLEKWFYHEFNGIANFKQKDVYGKFFHNTAQFGGWLGS